LFLAVVIMLKRGALALAMNSVVRGWVEIVERA
jgi:hypothetical protein